MTDIHCAECQELREAAEIYQQALILLNHRAAQGPVSQDLVVGVTGAAIEKADAIIVAEMACNRK